MVDTRKLGIIPIILGLIFILFPVVSTTVVSILIGLGVVIAGVILLTSGFVVLSDSKLLAVLNFILGLIAIIVGILFIVHVDVVPFIVGLEFFVIGLVFIFFGISGYFSQLRTISGWAALAVVVLGIVAIILGIFFADKPVLVAIFIGICLMIQGVRMLLK